ncbi:MAG: carboxypeptidase-like regulatory domain-containing protein [Bryobacter sp.]|nr:carboxypeptidase-like regulatory domain-containing protein [Bryobacter sp.]
MFVPSLRAYLLVAALALPLAAQQTTGTITGTVEDISGASVAGAAVEALNRETNSALRTRSGEDGSFVLNNVPPGLYRLTVQVAGFKTFEVRDLNVQVVRNTVVPVKLEPGTVTERIEIQAAADTVDVQSAVLKTNVGSGLILDLPSSSRNRRGEQRRAHGWFPNAGPRWRHGQRLGEPAAAEQLSP